MRLAPGDLDKMALQHVTWLAQTGRHTQADDALAAHAIGKGWARRAPAAEGAGKAWFRVELASAEAPGTGGGGMTRERLEALHGLVAAARECVRWLGPGKSVDEKRLMDALATVEACGADVAVVVAINGLMAACTRCGGMGLAVVLPAFAEPGDAMIVRQPQACPKCRGTGKELAPS